MSFGWFVSRSTVSRVPSEMGHFCLYTLSFLCPKIIDIVLDGSCGRLTITPAVHIIPCWRIELWVAKPDPIAYDAVPLENGFHHLLVWRRPHLNDRGFGCSHPESLVGGHEPGIDVPKFSPLVFHFYITLSIPINIQSPFFSDPRQIILPSLFGRDGNRSIGSGEVNNVMDRDGWLPSG